MSSPVGPRSLLVWTAPAEPAAAVRFEEFAERWGGRYPAVVRLWRSAWTQFGPLLDYDVEIRRVICLTNAIESLNARYRRAVPARGHFPNEQPRSSASIWSPGPWTRPAGQGLPGDALDARTQRLRDHLRRPYRSHQQQLTDHGRLYR